MIVSHIDHSSTIDIIRIATKKANLPQNSAKWLAYLKKNHPAKTHRCKAPVWPKKLNSCPMENQSLSNQHRASIKHTYIE